MMDAGHDDAPSGLGRFLDDIRLPDQPIDLSLLVERIPYARFLGLIVQQMGEEVITELPASEHLTGNQNLPAVHGGVVGAMLEFTAVLQLLHDTDCERLPKTVDISVDYLRPTRADRKTFGQAIVTRRGRRVANVRCELWQQDRSTPVAASHGHFVLAPVG